MNTDLNLVRLNLQSHLKESASSRGLTDSIRIQQRADPVDMTQEAAERDLAVQILDRESALARRLRSAMERVDDGSYGVCMECEDEIDPKRLKAMPWAEFCIHCQERADGFGSQQKFSPAFEESSEAA